MKTYRVHTYGDEATYTVSLNDDGVVEVDGISPESAENLKTAVARYIERRGIYPIAALDLAIGSYSHLTEVDDSVADSL